MRPIITFLLLSCSLASGQERSELRLVPPRPVEGHTITLQYRPARAFAPAQGESVVVEILSAGASTRVYDLTLKRSSRSFTGTWMIPSGAEALLFRVAVGERVDDRDGEGWAAPISDADGALVPRAKSWLTRAGAPGGLHGFRARVDGAAPDVVPTRDDEQTSAELDWRVAVAHRDVKDRWDALAEYLEAYPGSTDEAKVQVLIRSAIAAQEWDAADELIHRQPRKEPLWLIALSEGLMNANVTLDRASVLAKESLNAARNWDPAHKPALLSLREFRKQRASEVPLALRTYARSLVKLGYLALAEKVYHEAFELLGGHDSDLKNEYVAVLRTLRKEARVAEIERMSIR